MKLTKHYLSAAISALLALPTVSNAFELEEIVVTATKRAESLQDVPISVTAIGGEALSTGNFSDIRSITAKAPSVSITNAQTNSGSTSVKVRGIGTVGNNAGFESSVGIFIDGVYQPRPGIALSEFVDMSQVEVLRGPQGTLFGRNTSVGALNIKTNAPVLGETEGSIEASLGNYDLQNIKAIYNMPAGENLAFRVASSVRQRDGVIESAQSDVDDAHDKDRYLVRAQALWTPTEDISLRVIADTSKNDESCCTQVGIQANSNGTPTNGVPSFDADDFTSFGDQRGDNSDQYGLSAELTVETDIGTLTWIPAYRKSESETWGDNDWTSADMYFIPEETPNESNIESMTQELRLQGTAFDEKVDWLVGFYYSEEEITETSNYHTGPDNWQSMPWAVIAPPPAPGQPPVYVPTGPSPELWANNSFYQDGETFGIFTHNIISLTDNLNLTVGLRYTEEEKEGGLKDSDGFNPNCASFGPALLLPNIACNAIYTPAALSPNYSLYKDKFEDEALTYTLNLQYHLSDDISVYGSVSTGFKSGGVNLDVTGSGGTFDSEKITSYELGMKSTWMDGRVTANASWFYMDLEDFQLTVFDASTVSFQVFNVPEGKSEGFELDLAAQLSENFTLNTSYAYTDASFPDDCNGSVTNPKVIDMCGNTLPNAPEHSFVTSFIWDLAINDELNMTIAPSLRWDDESRATVAPDYVTDSTTMVDLSIVLRDTSDTWSVELWGKNLLDEAKEGRVINSLSNLPGQDAKIGFVSDPATYGLTARYNFF